MPSVTSSGSASQPSLAARTRGVWARLHWTYVVQRIRPSLRLRGRAFVLEGEAMGVMEDLRGIGEEAVARIFDLPLRTEARW